MQPERNTEFRSAAIAVAASLGLHLLLFWLLPDSFQKVVAFVRPVEVLTAPVKIDESRLPPKLRFAETNPAANQAVPKAAPFASSRNQTAAQPVPEKKPTHSPLPKSAGTSEQIRLAQGKPRSIDQSEAVPVAQPSISMAAREAGGNPFSYLTRQVLLTLFSVGCGAALFMVPTERYEQHSQGLLILALVLLLAVLQSPALGANFYSIDKRFSFCSHPLVILSPPILTSPSTERPPLGSARRRSRRGAGGQNSQKLPVCVSLAKPWAATCFVLVCWLHSILGNTGGPAGRIRLIRHSYPGCWSDKHAGSDTVTRVCLQSANAPFLNPANVLWDSVCSYVGQVRTFQSTPKTSGAVDHHDHHDHHDDVGGHNGWLFGKNVCTPRKRICCVASLSGLLSPARNLAPSFPLYLLSLDCLLDLHSLVTPCLT